MWPNKQRLGELSAARASLSPDDLRQRLPPVFADFLEHARNTNPADSPDYEHFKKAFAVVGSSEIWKVFEHCIVPLALEEVASLYLYYEIFFLFFLVGFATLLLQYSQHFFDTSVPFHSTFGTFTIIFSWESANFQQFGGWWLCNVSDLNQVFFFDKNPAPIGDSDSFPSTVAYTPKRRDSENALIFGSADLQSWSTEFPMAKNPVGFLLQDQWISTDWFHIGVAWPKKVFLVIRCSWSWQRAVLWYKSNEGHTVGTSL
jgi:hypothetical protein